MYLYCQNSGLASPKYAVDVAFILSIKNTHTHTIFLNVDDVENYHVF